MSFLKNIETPKKMISNTPTPMSVNELENTMESNSPESECIEVVNEDLDEATMGLDSSYEKIPAKTKKFSKHDAINDLLNIERDLNLIYLQQPRSEESNQACSNIIHNDSNQFITNYIQEPNQPFETTSSTYY